MMSLYFTPSSYTKAMCSCWWGFSNKFINLCQFQADILTRNIKGGDKEYVWLSIFFSESDQMESFSSGLVIAFLKLSPLLIHLSALWYRPKWSTWRPFASACNSLEHLLNSNSPSMQRISMEPVHCILHTILISITNEWICVFTRCWILKLFYWCNKNSDHMATLKEYVLQLLLSNRVRKTAVTGKSGRSVSKSWEILIDRFTQ